VRKRILEKIVELKKEQKKVARAFILEAKSSSPRNTGTEMLITEDGETYGTIGGGSDEKIVIEKAVKAISNKKSQKLQFSLSRKEAAEIGWVCGGDIDVFIQIIA